MEIDQIRQEYPHLVQLFKSSAFPPAMVKGLSIALDDLDDVPHHRAQLEPARGPFGAAFSGKYKSLFLGNQGTKAGAPRCADGRDRRGVRVGVRPRPDEYRAERGLLDVHEEMGILIQEVVGAAVGPVLPAGLLGRRVQQQRIPLVAAHQARGRSDSPRARAWGRARSTASPTTIPMLIAPGPAEPARRT